VRKHWPNLLSVIFRSGGVLNSQLGPLFFFDSIVECTYCIQRIEPAMYLVLIFEKRKESDSLTKEFLAGLSGALRLLTPLSSL
jgi:KICSTOR complex C12orf66 like